MPELGFPKLPIHRRADDHDVCAGSEQYAIAGNEWPADKVSDE
jgi:hypothetical protein